jgi:hypothetical protein
MAKRETSTCRQCVRAVYLVSCVSGKRASPTPAKDLYLSHWFAKARSYVEGTGCPWFILSAKCGLVAPEQVIAPYEQTLNNASTEVRRAWAIQVQGQMDKQLPAAARIVVLASRRYREFLMDYLASRASSVEVPMAGLRIGEQLSWLGRNRGGTSG